MRFKALFEKIFGSRSGRPTCHVVVDLRLLLPGGLNGGIKPAFFSLWQELRRMEMSALRCTFLTNSWSHEDLAPIRRPGDVAVCTKELEGRAPDETCFLAGDYSRIGGNLDWISSIGADVYYNPLGESLPELGSLPILVMHADVLHRDLPESLSAEEVVRRESFFVQNSERANCIHTISRFSRDQIERYYPAARGKTRVVRLPIQDRLSGLGVEEQSPIPEDYFLYPANFWNHKNHAFLVEVFRIYRKQFSGNCWDLVFTGEENDLSLALKNTVKSLGLEANVHFVGHMEDAQFAALMRSAGCVLFPSRYEGFGIPPLEAMMLNVPVVCSDAGSLPEVVGEGAWIVPTEDSRNWVKAMGIISTDESRRNFLIEKGRQVVGSYRLSEEVAHISQDLRKLAKCFQKQ